jgi:site-specific DNA-methyltransferase (adenine-specific)
MTAPSRPLAAPPLAPPIESTRLVASTQLGALYAVDALELLTALPDGAADLVFADPPYNAGRESWDAFASVTDYLRWSSRWIAESARVLAATGSLYICGFSEVLADIKAIAQRHFSGCRWLVWHYRNKANLGGDWGRSHESVLHLRKPGFRLDVDAARVPYNSHTTRYPAHPQAESSRFGRKRYTWRPHPLGAKPRDVLEVPTLANGMAEKTPHPTQKPLELVRPLVAAASPLGGLVIDPFGGSGTTYVACELLGRRWIGCETERSYRELISDRLRALSQEVGGTAPATEVERAATRRRVQRRRLR